MMDVIGVTTIVRVAGAGGLYAASRPRRPSRPDQRERQRLAALEQIEAGRWRPHQAGEARPSPGKDKS